jgi:hypothetical protein
MINQNAICAAEDTLFNVIKKHPLSSYLPVAYFFYSRLNTMDDNSLLKANFPRKEIAQGISDVQKILKVC